MSTIANIFNSLAADNSRLAKESILKLNKDNEELQRVIRLALDPLISFYIRKIPVYNASGKQDLSWAMDQIENSFATRQVTGNAAIDLLKNILESLNEADASVVEKIIKKDLRCGVSEATANKIWPKLVSTYPVMLASGFDQKLVDKIKFPAYCQLKLDGMRFNAIVKENTVEYRSRNGKELIIPNSNLDKTFIELSLLFGTDTVFDGELLVSDSNGKPLDRKTGNGILSKSVKGTMSANESLLVRATLWDYIPYTDFKLGVYNTKYEDRLNKLSEKIVSFAKKHSDLKQYIELVPTTEVSGQDVAQEIFEKFLAEGQEGTILKSKSCIWEDKRSKGQIKFKGELECDLKIVAFEEGTGKNAGRLGAIIVESSDGVIQVNVGSGFTDSERDEFWSNRKTLLGKIVAVKYNARIKDRGGNVERLFLPIFIELREDKTIADTAKDVK